MAKYKWDNLILFTEQLASAARLELPLDKAIESMSKESVDLKWKDAQESVSELHASGASLAEAMESNGQYFPSMMSRLVRVGEEGKILPTILQSVSRYLQTAQEVQHRLQRCLVYPFFVWCMLAIEIGIMFLVVVPKLYEMYISLGISLPGLSHLLFNVGPAVLVLGVGLFFYLAWLTVGVVTSKVEPTNGAAKMIDSYLPYIPFLGVLSRHAKAAQICEVMGVLMDGGHSGKDAVVLAKGMVDSASMNTALDEVETAIVSGEAFQATRQNTLIPQTSLWMIAQSHNKQELGQMLQHLAALHRRQLDILSNNVKEIMEPLLFILVAVFGGLAIIGFYLPIFNIAGGIFQITNL